MTAARPSAAPPAIAGALLAAGLLLTACGGDAEADAAVEEAVGDAVAEGLPEAPEQCLAPFPLAVGGATLDDVDLIPADWPAAPDGAVLCGTGGTLDGNQDYAEYAVTLDGEALLAYYQGAFPAGYTVEPTDTIGGPGLTGTAGDVTFVVEPRDGGMNLVFAVEG
jgi:hypothetical protein